MGLLFKKRLYQNQACVADYKLKSSNIMAQGIIKKIVSDKGFGFIETGNQELFFHSSSVKGAAFDDLQEGQTVEFTEGSGPKGPRADSVRPVDS